MYSKNGKILYLYADGKSETSFKISDNVTEIYDYAFGGARNLEDIEIPNSVTKIGNLVLCGSQSNRF